VSIIDCQTLGLIFHGMISSYQAAIRDTFGNSDVALINHVEYLCDNVELEGVDAGRLGFEELVRVMAEKVGGLNLAKIGFEKVGPSSYLFRVDQCVWAETLHKRKEDRDVTCPWGLIALAICQTSTWNSVFVADLEYLPTGSRIKVRIITDIINQIIVDEKG
jgi:hypothetical protein